MSQKILRIATRNSPLALWQANHVRQVIIQHWPMLQVDLLPMTTSGDQFLKDKLLTIGNKGLFVKELEEALLDGRADIAVHSMKDVPTTFPEGLKLAVICTRNNPFDALVSKAYDTLDALPVGAIVGTASLRRQSQLLTLRPDLSIKSLRGNINTRLGKLEAGEYDAIILAAAGLERLGMQHAIKEMIDDSIMLPACGQGALGIECRVGDGTVQSLIAPLNDPLSALCVQVERHVNGMLGGNCHTPLAVFCTENADSTLWLRAKIATTDGKIVISDSLHGPQHEAIALAETCAQRLLAKGAADLLAMALHD